MIEWLGRLIMTKDEFAFYLAGAFIVGFVIGLVVQKARKG